MANAEIVYHYLTVVIALLITLAAGDSSASAPAAAVTKYVNHTVGGAAGWFFDAKTNKTSADYSAWAASETFSLGDYLIFNTSSNQTVIQTTDKTTFKSCSIDANTNQFYGGNDQFDQPATVAVPLTTEGPNYYFSSAFDGEQCLHGLAFAITVNHGLGLPPSLNQPPPPPYSEAPEPSRGESVPVPVISDSPSDGGRIGFHWVVSGLVVLGGGLVVM